MPNETFLHLVRSKEKLRSENASHARGRNIQRQVDLQEFHQSVLLVLWSKVPVPSLNMQLSVVGFDSNFMERAVLFRVDRVIRNRVLGTEFFIDLLEGR
jgi:hypothetical protein